MSATATPRRQRKRGYQMAGFYGASRAIPGVLDRARDPEVSDEDLRPFELAARELRREILEDLGDVSAAKRALVDVVVGSLLCVGAADHYIFAEGGGSAVIDRRKRQIRRLILDRDKLATGLTRQLLAIGLDRRRKAPTLAEYVEERSRHVEADPDVEDGDGAQQGAEEADR